MEHSPLGILPTELRNEIYSLVVIQPRDIQLIDRGGKIICGDTFDGKRRHNILAITETCRLMRIESLPVFYGRNSFFLNTKPDITSMGRSRTRKYRRLRYKMFTFRRWLESIGKPERSSIKHLTLDLEFWTTALDPSCVARDWWILAKTGRFLLLDGGLSETCQVRAFVALPRPLSRLQHYCGFYGPARPIHDSRALTLSVKSRSEAVLEAERVFVQQGAELFQHMFHSHCDLGHRDVLLNALCDLFIDYDMVLDTFGMQPGESETARERFSCACLARLEAFQETLITND